MAIDTSPVITPEQDRIGANADGPHPGDVIVTDKSTLRVKFVPVTTGITGSTDIEVLTGLKEGDEIATGHYKVLRTLKSGTAIKRDTTIETADDSSS